MPQDILLDDNFDLRIENGDFVVGESTNQHAEILLLSEKGDIRQYPFLGVGIKSFINDDSLEDLPGEIDKQFKLDGAKVRKREVFENGKINLDVVYDEES